MAFRRLPSDFDAIRQNTGSTDWSTISIPRFGTDSADTMRGGSGRDNFYGSGGNDTLFGNGGVDTFHGGADTDTVDYSNVTERAPDFFTGATGVIVDLASGQGGEVGEARDTYDSIENVTGSNFDDFINGDANANVLRGLNGNDVILGGAGGDTLDGGEGIDTLSYVTSNARVSVNLQTGATSGGHAAGDIISGFENITGSNFNDTLTGDARDNVIEGGLGGDTLDGAGGVNDTVSYRTSNAGVTVNLATRTASGGHAQGDIISGFENIDGSGFRDVLTGSFENNRIFGGADADTIDGGRGNDTLEGGAGDDILTGGLQSDNFVFRYHEDNGHDHITDFRFGEDHLQLDINPGDETTLNLTFDVEVLADNYVNLTFDFGNGSSVTLDHITAIDALFIQLEGI